MNVPLWLGVPLIVIVLLAQLAVTPEGRPDAAPIPVALVVVCVMFVNAVLIHRVGLLLGPDTVAATQQFITPASPAEKSPNAVILLENEFVAGVTGSRQFHAALKYLPPFKLASVPLISPSA